MSTFRNSHRVPSCGPSLCVVLHVELCLCPCHLGLTMRCWCFVHVDGLMVPVNGVCRDQTEGEHVIRNITG